MGEAAKIIVEAVILVLGIGFISWQIRRLSVKVDAISDAHHECRESLPKEYASKDEVSKLWERTDTIERDISYFKGRMNGKATVGACR